MNIGSVVMPGDVLFDISESETKLIYGPGLRRESDKIITTKCGVLKQTSSNIYYIDNHQTRYVPVRGENVIAIVLKKGGEEAMLDIGGSESAVVDLLSFEGATKRNKPQLKPGDIIFAKILSASKDSEPELVCIDKFGKSVGFGLLPKEGFFFNVSLEYCRRLLLPDATILKRLSQSMPFEIAVGMNGRVWIKASTTEKTLVCVQVILVLEHASESEIERYCGGMTSAGFL